MWEDVWDYCTEPPVKHQSPPVLHLGLLHEGTRLSNVLKDLPELVTAQPHAGTSGVPAPSAADLTQ